MRTFSGKHSACGNNAGHIRFRASPHRGLHASVRPVVAWTSTPGRPGAVPGAVPGARAASGQAASAADALLQWACSGWAGPDDAPAPSTSSAGPGGGGPLRVAVAELGPGRGRGLVATVDVAPGETLLSVPLTRVFTSEPDSELHWSAGMALRLLRARHLAAAAAAAAPQRQAPAAPASGASAAAAAAAEEAQPGGGAATAAAATTAVAAAAGPETLGEAGWAPWIRALPSAVRTPLEYGEDELRQLGCPYVMEEIRVMQQCVRDCYEELRQQLAELGCGWADFLWAVQVFHSRCFFEPGAGLHMCVPGVDMANHSAAPSAGVRVQHSPGACQGYDALAEVAEPPPPQPSRFNLVAGEAGIRRGEEVTISYGSWPSEAFLLLFGFVPSAAAGSDSTGSRADGGGGSSSSSPGDCLTLFRDAEEAVRWCVAAARAAAAGRSQPPEPGEGNDGEALVETILAAVESTIPSDALFNFVVTPEGFESRLQALLQIAVTEGQLGLSPRDLLLGRLKERFAHFEEVGPINDETIARFVRSKRCVARGVLRQLVGA